MENELEFSYNRIQTALIPAVLILFGSFVITLLLDTIIPLFVGCILGGLVGLLQLRYLQKLDKTPQNNNRSGK